MRKLEYKINNKVITELLGKQNFTNKESAILELVKNSYDALATELLIEIVNNSVIISDNGIGMDAKDIKSCWMHIGKSNKKYEVKNENGEKRILAGSKGIGRFALSRLGEKVELHSTKNGSNPILWATDWEEITLEEKIISEERGTKIIIKQLRDKWNLSAVENLKNYLSRSYNDTAMKIIIRFNGENYPVEKYFLKSNLGIECTSKLTFNYISENEKLIFKIESDEFKEEARQYYKKNNLFESTIVLNMVEELVFNNGLDIDKKELKKILNNLGNFTGELYFSLATSLSDGERFLYKHTKLKKPYNSGIILYRNSFSISSYEGSKDWLELGKRARKSPAAATHPTGAWRVRENNLSGKIEIDKEKNKMLMDLSNRQGLEENEYYIIFTEIIRKAISLFERYRQEIIREINKKNIIEHVQDYDIDYFISSIIKEPKILKEMDDGKLKTVAAIISDFRENINKYAVELDTTEKRYKYDVRILNILSTSGLKSTSLAHELHNDRNDVFQISDKIIEALKEHEVWEIVDKQENKILPFFNVPELLEGNKKINEKIMLFMDSLLYEVEKRQFELKEQNVLDIINEIKLQWEKDYSWININLENLQELLYKTSYDIIKVIFDNLILNSIQQNKDCNSLKIAISITLKNKELEVIYRDFGKGLDLKYKNDPLKILEVHETTRNDGHGLGMWIVNNTVVMSGGKILEINGDNGFCIIFSLGGEV